MKIIIAGFPGVGKSTAAMVHGTFVKDMESSNYHWIISDDGNKVPNPDWPMNYYDAIIAEAFNDGCSAPLYIAISTHKEVLETLVRFKIPFIIYTPATKSYAIGRYEARGNTPEFIEKIDKNWDQYMMDLDSYRMHVIKRDDYLTDFLESAGTYASLRNIIDLLDKGIDPITGETKADW